MSIHAETCLIFNIKTPSQGLFDLILKNNAIAMQPPVKVAKIILQNFPSGILLS